MLTELLKVKKIARNTPSALCSDNSILSCWVESLNQQTITMSLYPSTPTPDGHSLNTTAAPRSTGIDTAIVAGVITAVMISILCLAVLVYRYLYKQKGSYLTNEEGSDQSAMPLEIEDPLAEVKNEYFI
ncbi:small cell adhesion glycoprotein homolog [Heptranchias perlo]|uniref:small cell adhesion glycoprotein homolog n=1 Tax=Heptranchias perlo TaxID=212740 RepID=UPI0035597E34